MPFPWNKVKSTRISRLVNDHLHNSQKRRDGSSLVVETGFPTSLVDLFIKNREKLKKPSKKKPTPMITPLIAELPTPVHSPLRCPSPLRSPSLLPLPSRGVNEILVVGSCDGGTFVGVDERECGAERGVDANRVLLVVLKMFLVVVLALGTRRLTIGITISAFLLFFLEYVGKHACGLLKPCSEAKGVLRLMIQSVSRLLRFKEVKLDEKNGGALMPEVQQEHSLKPGCSSLKTTGSRCPDQEIQVVEQKSYMVTHVEEIQPENEIMDGSCFKGRLGYQEIESKEVVMEKEESMCEVAELKRKSRRAKINSKMKKFVPKKLRRSRKEQDPQRLDIVKEDSIFLFDEREVDQCEDEGESENASELSSISSGRYKEEEGKSAICAFGGLSKVSEKAGIKIEEKSEEIEAGLTWRYLVLCLIVLVGLIGGRAFALLLTLSWCLLLKIGETLPRYMKLLIIRSINDKSG
ncbi:hypothetical protein Pfo_012581 [Paulownia fortunei]|nr:hypothetical protein Pfo_012581 [Paulownia fortunei]